MKRAEPIERECEFCDEVDVTVRWRRTPDEENLLLCAACWQDVQAGFLKERQYE